MAQSPDTIMNGKMTSKVATTATTWDAKTLRRLFLQACIYTDTHSGKDKPLRFIQYLARCLSGLTGNEVCGNLLAAMSLSRKTLRFGLPIRLQRQIENCWQNEKDSVNKWTTLTEVGSFLIYCWVDHLCFAQKIGLLKLNAVRSDYLDRFAEFFWLTEVIPVGIREARTYLTGGGAMVGSAEWQARRRKALILLVKFLFDLQNSIYFMMPAAYRNQRKNKALAGFLGIMTSAISIKMGWPSDKCLTA
eukprot:TRINITY_DN16778_c0_g1_i1.p1 TRINITY_DN16778_c0_g1~~TRINITY_DN16778_c0_g1_i1.p1  ORF type:complete len:247 (+),score=49.23 TRINITY_DN16778_c0_g1_i1:76-816(+)